MEDIKFDKRNYRIHTETNKELIKKSLEELGTGRSIIIDSQNEIIGGNGVYEQAKELGIPVKIIETDGSELIAVKRTDLKTNDEKRKKMAILDNTTSDTSIMNNPLLLEDFSVEELRDLGVTSVELGNEALIDQEELMDNDNLQEMNTSKALALSKMPIGTYLVIKFDENCTKEDFIEHYAKQWNPDSDIDVKTQFCTYAFMKKDPLDD